MILLGFASLAGAECAVEEAIGVEPVVRAGAGFVGI